MDHNHLRDRVDTALKKRGLKVSAADLKRILIHERREGRTAQNFGYFQRRVGQPSAEPRNARHDNRKRVLAAMIHRHLNHQRFTLAAIDDVILRGRWRDWAALRRAVLTDRSLLDKVERVCASHIADPYAQRHHFWMHYVQQHRPTS